ncbi:hypothetical protein ACTU45_08605 [Streptomyces sp. 24-1644]|uniref:hypothetical protein n=1 Tax=Streptomyces sp. 24-1644 TaxID=3457315 RepID=UPI003FA73D13
MNHGSENTPEAPSSASSDGAEDRGQSQGQAPDQEPELEPERELERDVAPQPEPEPHSVQARDTAADGDSAAPAPDGDSAADTSVLTSLFGRGPASRPDADGGPGADAGHDLDAGLDELALRRMLHGAVQDLEPSNGTLDHLHRAVPARRARRRQAVVGVAAAALLIGTAVPAFVHVARSDGETGVNSAIAGHGEQAQGGSGEEPGKEPGDDKEPGPADEVTDGGKGEPDASASPSSEGDDTPDPQGIGGVADTPRSEAAAVPSCGPGQLRVDSAEAGAPGADGTVYGTFRISNMSGEECSVSGDGSVGVQAMGAADPLKVQVVQHTAGDPASGLPDPSLEPGTVMLKPAMAYEVRFAWVPSDTCPETVPPPSPTPTDGAGGSTGEGAASTGTEAQFGSEDGGTADGSIAVTHTPEAGSPSAQTTISNACAGTVYRTGVLTVSQ